MTDHSQKMLVLFYVVLLVTVLPVLVVWWLQRARIDPAQRRTLYQRGWWRIQRSDGTWETFPVIQGGTATDTSYVTVTITADTSGFKLAMDRLGVTARDAGEHMQRTLRLLDNPDGDV